MEGKYGRKRPYYRNIVPALEVIEQKVAFDDFTDVAASGYVDLTAKLPAGAIPLGWKARVDEGFTDIATYTPEDGTKIMFRQDTLASDVDMILDLTGCTVITPADGTTIAFTNTTNSTITDSADGFGDVVDGDLLLVQGSTSNDGVFVITTATDAGTLTLTGEKFTAAEAGVAGISFTILNNADAGGFVDAGFVNSDGITIAGSESNDGDIASGDITTVKAGVITLGNTVLTAAEDGLAGISFTKEITTAAVIELGIDGDTDSFSADTAQSVATAATVGSTVLAADACNGMDDDVTVRVTVTETSDFSSYTAGEANISLYYLKT